MCLTVVLGPEDAKHGWSSVSDDICSKSRMSIGPSSDQLEGVSHDIQLINNMSTETTKAVRSGALNANDARVIEQARRNIQEVFRGEIDVNTSYESFTGTGGSYNSGYGAIAEPTLSVSRNKDQSRESVIKGAEAAGVSYHQIIPFADSAMATKDHQYSEDVQRLIDLGWHGRKIRRWVNEQGGVDIDESDCPCRAQIEEDLDEYDLLIGSPGHENVERFRIGRRTIHDDTHPVLHYMEKNQFDISDSRTRAKFDEFLKAADQLGPDNMEQLSEDSVAQTRIGFLRSKVDDEDSPHFIDDVSIALDGEFVDAKTLGRLKVYCGFTPDTQGPKDDEAGQRIWEAVPEYDDGETVDIDVVETQGDYALMNGNKHNPNLYWWAPIPNEDQTTIFTSATDNDPVTKAYFEMIGADYEFRTCHTNEFRYWQAQNLRVLQMSDHQNARSGGNINAERTEDLRKGIQIAEGLDDEVPVVDALKSLEKWVDGDVRNRDDVINAARAPSFNGFEDHNVGFVPGPQYYGDEYVRALALFCGEDIKIEHNGSDESCSHNRCNRKRAHCHNETGQYILEHMMKSSIKQAVGRFGRNSKPHEEVRVYVDSNRIPAELPTEDFTDRMVEFSPGEKAILDVIAHADREITTAEIAEQTDQSRGHVRDVTKRLSENDWIDRERDNDTLSKVHGRDDPVDSRIIVTMGKSTGAIPISEPVHEDGDELGPQYPDLGKTVTRSSPDSPSMPDPPDVI